MLAALSSLGTCRQSHKTGREMAQYTEKKKTKETGSSRKSIGEIKTIRKVRLHRTFWKIVRVCISQK